MEDKTCARQNQACDNDETAELEALPAQPLLSTSSVYPSRHVTQSDAVGPEQPWHD